MSRRGLRLGAIAVATVTAVTALGARPAAAHPLDLGYLRLDAEGQTLRVAFDLHVNAAAHLLGVEPAALDPAALARQAGALADAALRRAPIVSAEGPCGWAPAVTSALRDRTVSLTLAARCAAPPRAIRWALPVVGEARVSPTFQILAKLTLAGELHAAVVDPLHPQLAVTATDAPGLLAFVGTGVEHIGATPHQWHDASGWRLPDGLDHILFLLALLLAGGSLVQLLGVVSGFTLGHSITLALATLHVVRPPAALIEPLIALSIALVAAQTARGRPARHRVTVAAAFGLLHGFGFASALDQLALPTGARLCALLGFNLGVELGQAIIVLAAAPLVFALHRHRRLHPVIRGLAAAITLAGVVWFFQRL